VDRIGNSFRSRFKTKSKYLIKFFLSLEDPRESVTVEPHCEQRGAPTNIPGKGGTGRRIWEFDGRIVVDECPKGHSEELTGGWPPGARCTMTCLPPLGNW
jgi:hypothetical protein